MWPPQPVDEACYCLGRAILPDLAERSGYRGVQSAEAVGRTTVRIAQIAPLIESVPPRLYGGTERIVSYLTEELVALGHCHL